MENKINYKKKKITNNRQLMSLSLMLGIFIVCGLIFILLNTSSSYTLSQDAFQIVAGQKVVFKSGTSFLYKENGVTYKGAEDNEYIASTPLYLDNNQIVIANDSIYIDARKVTFHKFIGLNEVTNDGQIKYKNSFVNGGFIYDGKKTYTFLEKMELDVNGKKIEVGPFSSITMSSNKMYCLYNTSKKGIDVDKVYSDSIYATCTDYRIDIANDVLYDKDDKKLLLVNRTDILDEYK